MESAIKKAANVCPRSLISHKSVVGVHQPDALPSASPDPLVWQELDTRVPTPDLPKFAYESNAERSLLPVPTAERLDRRRPDTTGVRRGGEAQRAVVHSFDDRTFALIWRGPCQLIGRLLRREHAVCGLHAGYMRVGLQAHQSPSAAYLTIRKRLQYVNKFPRAGRAASMTDTQSLIPAPRSLAAAMSRGALIALESVLLSGGGAAEQGDPPYLTVN